MRLCNCRMNEFADILENRKVILFGRGYAISAMLNMWPRNDWQERIKYIVDNDRFLWGTEAKINNYKFKIVSPEALKQEGSSDILIIITSVKFFEIIGELDAMHELDKTDCYIFSLMQTASSLADKNFRCESDIECIPKVIHFCWFGGNPLSEQAKYCIDSWKKFCPDFKIKRWDETNYDINKNAYVSEAFHNRGYAFVSDFARLDILYQFGGIYMDTDVEVIKDLTPLLYNKAYCSFANHAPRIATGLGLGAMKGFPLLLDMMEIYKYERYIMDYGPNKTLSQTFNTKVMLYHGLVQNGKYQVVDGMTCYPKDYFDPRSSHFGLILDDSKAFCIHHSSNSWNDGGDANVKREAGEQIRSVMQRIDRGGYSE